MKKKANLISEVMKGLFIVVLISALFSMAFAATKGSNAKKFYIDALNRLSKSTSNSLIDIKTGEILITKIDKSVVDLDLYHQKLEIYESEKLSGDLDEDFDDEIYNSKLAYDENYLVYIEDYKKDIEEYYNNNSNNEYFVQESVNKFIDRINYLRELHKNNETTEKTKILFDEEKGLLFKEYNSDSEKQIMLYNSNENRLYTKREDGTVIFCTPNSYITSQFDGFFINSGKETMEISRVLVDALKNNLKDEYFTESKENGVNIYTISMNKSQIKEFFINLINDLSKNDEFENYILKEADIDQNDFDEYIKEMLIELESEFDVYEELKFELNISMKGKDFAGTSFNFVTDDEELIFEIFGEKGKSLKKSTKGSFELKIKSYSNEYRMKGEANFDKKKISITYSTYSYSKWNSWTTNEEVIDEDITNHCFEIKGLDGKDLNKSSKIQIEHNISYDNKNKGYTYKFIIESKNKKSLDKADIINISYLEKYDESVSFNGSAIISGDNKELFKSKNINVELFEYDEKFGEMSIISNDNKELKKSNEFTIKIFDEYDDSVVIDIKVNDRNIKNIKEFQMEICGADFNYKCSLKSNDNKDIFKSSDITIEYIDVFDEAENFHLHLKALDGLSFNSTHKLQIDFLVSEMNCIINIESKDNKQLLDSKDYKIELKANGFDGYKNSELYLIMDSNKIDGKYSNSYQLLSTTFYTEGTLTFRELNESRINELFDTSNAVEASINEVAELLNFDYYDYEELYNQIMNSYYNDLYDEDDNFFEIVVDTLE